MFKQIKLALWQWPDGLVWKMTSGLTARSRKKKYALFMQLMQPQSSYKILDVGVGGGDSRTRNFLEASYPHPEQITGVGIEDLEEFQKTFPKVTVVRADARNLPFADHSFDIVFSNAVIEHLGATEQQQKFVQECLRVGKRLFITTPAREFIVDPHTLIPFAHWFPMPLRNIIYRMLGRGYYASEDRLHLLTSYAFYKLFPKDAHVKIHKERILGLPAVLIAYTV